MAVLVPSIGIYSAVDYILDIFNNKSKEIEDTVNPFEKTQNKEEDKKYKEIKDTVNPFKKTPEIEQKISQDYPTHKEWIKQLLKEKKQEEQELLEEKKQDKLLKEQKQQYLEKLKLKLIEILRDKTYYPRDISINELGNNSKYFQDTIKIDDLLEYFPNYSNLINKQKELIDKLELTKEKKQQVYNMTQEIIKIKLIKKFRDENMPRFLEYGEPA